MRIISILITIDCYLDSCPNKKIHEDRLHLGLPTLEVISTNKTVSLNSQLNQACRNSEINTNLDIQGILACNLLFFIKI